MTQKSRHGVSAIPVFGSFFEYFFNTQMLYDVGRGFFFIQALCLGLLVEFPHSVVQKMSDFFHYRDGIGLFFGMHAQLNEVLKKLIGVGHVKITCNDQVAVHPIILTQKRVNGFDTVTPKSAVAHMPQKQFAQIRYALFLKVDVITEIRVFGKFVIDALVDLPENILNRLGSIGADTTDITLTRRDIEFNPCQSSTVLATIVLLFHHQIHLVDPVKRRPVFFFIKA